MKTPTHIVVFGGGTGAPVVLNSLILAGFSDLTVISASMDSGGKTGIIRTDERDRVIAISDLLRCLLSLVDPKHNHLSQVSAFFDLAGFTDGRNRNLGYTIYYALLEKYHNDFLQVQRHLEKLIGIQFLGQAIPVTLDSTNIHFKTENGSEFRGEHELDRQSMSTNSVVSMWLDPPVSATPEAILAITSATHIIYAPGSIYGSILSNFLPTGVTSALKKSPAKKIIITNLVSTRNQTHSFTPIDYFQLFRTYTKLSRPFDYIIAPQITQTEFSASHSQVASSYASEHSHFLSWSKSDFAPLTAHQITPILSDIVSITPQLNRIRHDPNKLSKILKKIILPRR